MGQPQAAWWSQAPTSSGLYRGSMDMQVTKTATQCSTDDAGVSQAQPAGPSCPGSTMKVGERTVCAGTAAAPVDADQSAGVPGGSPGNKGNPPAGDAGSGGTGSGRVPAVGVGGPAGGPVGSTGGGIGTGVDANGNPTGTTNTPGEGTEQAACGAPGQPRCAIDETGTPRSAAGIFDPATAAADAAKTQIDTKITEAKALQAPGWTWTFTLPTACSAIELPAFGMSIDVCQWQGLIHDILALCWIGATIWCCIGMVGRTLQGA